MASLPLLAWLVVAPACGDGATEPSPPAPTATVRITSTGVSPKSIEIALGARVLFINNDTVDHNMGSDPHPDHTDCPVINQVGLLRPGQQRETGNFVVARVCGYHDHDLPTVQSLQGTITAR